MSKSDKFILGFFWKLFSIIYNPEKTRGHVSLVTATDIEKEFAPMKIKKKQFIQTSSITLNKILPRSEKISMYAFFIFQK